MSQKSKAEAPFLLDFVDGVEKNREHPDSFLIPSDAEKAALSPGAFVKVGVMFAPTYNKMLGATIDTERFWMQVDRIEDSNVIGRVSNVLVFTKQHGLGPNDLVQVEPRHLLAIMTPRRRKD